MKLHTLSGGDRFRVAALPELVGTVVEVRAGSVSVRYDGGTTRHVTAKKNGEVKEVEFFEANKPLSISLNTEVERI